MHPDELATLFGTLNRAGVKYVVVGGLAVIYWGYTRPTSDVDLVVALDAPNALRAVQALAELGYRPRVPVPIEDFADAAKRADWRDRRNMLVFQLDSDRFRQMPIDLFLTEPLDVDIERAQGAQAEVAPGVTMPVVRYETLRRLKAEAGRMTDLADLEQLEKIHTDWTPREKEWTSDE